MGSARKPIELPNYRVIPAILAIAKPFARRGRKLSVGMSGAASVAVQKSASFLRAKSDMRTSEPKPH
jgi:hypothetical protein